SPRNPDGGHLYDEIAQWAPLTFCEGMMDPRVKPAGDAPNLPVKFAPLSLPGLARQSIPSHNVLRRVIDPRGSSPAMTRVRLPGQGVTAPVSGRGCWFALLLPGLEGVGEDALTGRAFLQGEDGAAVVVVNNRDVEPAALLEHLQIAILVGIDVGEADEIEAGRHLDREAGERHAARLLG